MGIDQKTAVYIFKTQAAVNQQYTILDGLHFTWRLLKTKFLVADEAENPLILEV